jgi:hypothetical protein
MVFVEIDSVVVHTTGVTATSGMLTVLSFKLQKKSIINRGFKTLINKFGHTDTAVAMADMPTKFPGLLPVGRLFVNNIKGTHLVKTQHDTKLEWAHEDGFDFTRYLQVKRMI